ncbi:hypothetical protein [Litchfieldia alkalitelluris]|uniref:hypothetical protein n=1 Tax=Litchfieldia alkalitelluris TaxID=304268 RepID=UPI000997B10A|nr:hypothetical protein [Litchfieldia alkalitelluris]
MNKKVIYLLVAAVALMAIFTVSGVFQQKPKASADESENVKLVEVIGSSPINTITYNQEEYQGEMAQMEEGLSSKEVATVTSEQLEEAFARTVTLKYSDNSSKVYEVYVQFGENYEVNGFFQPEGDDKFYQLENETAELMSGMFAN